jgi:predicted DNA-binding antitoxin AbrB/MazE fold protein
MTHRVTAIYEDGVLRPLSSLELPEHSQVEIDIHQVSSATDSPAHRDQVNQALGLTPFYPFEIVFEYVSAYVL